MHMDHIYYLARSGGCIQVAFDYGGHYGVEGADILAFSLCF